MSASAPRAVWLFVDLARDFGGHEVMLLRWIAALRGDPGIRPLLVCANGSRLMQNAQDLCEVHTVDPAPAAAGKLAMLRAICRLLSTMRNLKRRHAPELAIIAEGGLMAQRHGLYVARLLRLCTVLYVPIVESFTAMAATDAARLDARVRNVYGRLPDAWLTITREQGDAFRAWSGIRQPVFQLPNTVTQRIEDAAGRFLPRGDRRADDHLRVLVLSRLDAGHKGLDLLLDHLRRTPALADEMRITLCGEGPYRAQIEAARNALPHLQTLLCLRPWADPLQAFAEHDALLITSRFEGVPLVMLEAMCLGIPVIASDLPGTRPYLDASCRYPVGRLDVAFDRLRQLHRAEARRQEIGVRNLERFRSTASGAAFAEAVKTLTPRLRRLAGS